MGVESTARRRGGDSSGPGKPGDRVEVYIDGRFYDVTEFRKRHPGGAIINYGVGTDASAAFREFHARSAARAGKLLKALPSREATDAERRSLRHERRDAVLEDFTKLRDELTREGFFEPSPAHIAYRVAELLVMHVLGLWLAFGAGWPTLGTAVFALANGRCGWFMHECGHGSMTGRPWLDKALQTLAYGLGTGMSGSYWNNQHNKHHATPQKLGHDVDLNTLPLVAFDAAVPARARPGALGRLWLRAQALLFAPVSTMLVVTFWAFYLHPRFALRRGRYDELAAIAARHLFIFSLFTFRQFLLIAWVGGVYIFVNFSLSHTHRPVVERDAHVNWVAYSADYTVNIEPSWWCDWWMGYLNYQIEHHLFPSMPQFRQRLAAPRVRKLFEKHGYTYHCISYAEGVRRTVVNLFEVGNELPSTVKKL